MIYLFKRVLEAFVPSSIKSILVNTPRVLSPLGSNFLAKLRASELDKSILAGITQRIIVSSLSQYSLTKFLVIYSIFSG